MYHPVPRSPVMLNGHKTEISLEDNIYVKAEEKKSLVRNYVLICSLT